jgi:hypothetical protein
MAILGLVLAGITQMFTGVLTQFKQQSRIAETSIEGIVGLELLRQDLENAGFGLPWRLPATVAYLEAVATTAYIDFPSNDSTTNPPRAFVAGSGAGWSGMGAIGSDVLIIKATNVARSNAAQNWTYLFSAGTKTWDVAGENLVNTDRVIVLEPGTTEANRRSLARSSVDPTEWRATFQTATTTVNFAPAGSGYNFVYGVAPLPDTLYAPILRMPFNRADYYIVKLSELTTPLPARCAPNTSVFSKNIISHNDGARQDNLPLLDCVADMQVVFRLDRDGDGIVESNADVLTDTATGVNLTAEQIRNQLKEVRVYILAHEGQMDRSYTHPTTDIYVGETAIGNGRTFNIGANVNYRWKLYTLVVKPKNLR